VLDAVLAIGMIVSSVYRCDACIVAKWYNLHQKCLEQV